MKVKKPIKISIKFFPHEHAALQAVSSVVDGGGVTDLVRSVTAHHLLSFVMQGPSGVVYRDVCVVQELQDMAERRYEYSVQEEDEKSILSKANKVMRSATCTSGLKQKNLQFPVLLRDVLFFMSGGDRRKDIIDPGPFSGISEEERAAVRAYIYATEISKEGIRQFLYEELYSWAEFNGLAFVRKGVS